MAGRGAKPSLFEAFAHPFATLNRVAGLDRLPDRRVSRRPGPSARAVDSSDPIRRETRTQSVYRAMGLLGLEESRPDLYQNFREMDTDPVLAAVLDAFGGDAAQRDPEHRRVVWCESPNGQVCGIVMRALDRLRIEQLAFPIMRALARDGDVFMHIATAPGHGAVALRAYEPWQVARIEDEIGRLQGFAPADELGRPSRVADAAVPHYRCLHFRLPPRELVDPYGATSSYLWGSRVTWRQLQIMMDQVVIQRLLRRPDRLAIMMDATGMSHDDAWQTVKDYERRLYREWWANPAGSQFASQGTPLDIAKDIVLPRGSGNQTTIQGFPATNTNDLMKDVYFLLAMLAAGVGFPLGFVGMGDAATYTAGQSLARQSQPFAKRAARLQDAFLAEIVRLCMIDLAFQGLDPYHPHNAFSLAMSTISPIQEIERNEIIQLKTDRMERSIALGTNAGLARDIWIPFVLEKYGGLSRELIRQVYRPGAPAPEQMVEPGQQPTTDIAYTKLAEGARAALHQEAGMLVPDLERGARFGSASLIEAVRDQSGTSWRPDRPDACGIGTPRIDDLVKGAPFGETAGAALEQANAAADSKRRERAETRVQLMSSLAQMVDAGAL